MTIKEKILTFLDAQGIKKTDFFEAIGLSPSNFKGIAKQTELGGEKIAKILTLYPQLSAEWLMRGTGPMLLAEVDIPTTHPTPKDTIQTADTSNIAALSPFVERLMDKLDNQEAISRKQAEEIGRLKARIEELERVPLVHPSPITEAEAISSRPVLQNS